MRAIRRDNRLCSGATGAGFTLEPVHFAVARTQSTRSQQRPCRPRTLIQFTTAQESPISGTELLVVSRVELVLVSKVEPLRHTKGSIAYAGRFTRAGEWRAKASNSHRKAAKTQRDSCRGELPFARTRFCRAGAPAPAACFPRWAGVHLLPLLARRFLCAFAPVRLSLRAKPLRLGFRKPDPPAGYFQISLHSPAGSKPKNTEISAG